MHYLKLGAAMPTRSTIAQLKSLDTKQQLEEWKTRDHSQHCLAFHLEGCKRGHGCCFLHVEAIDTKGNKKGTSQSYSTTFEEQEKSRVRF